MTQGIPEDPWSGGWWGLKSNEYKRIKIEVSRNDNFLGSDVYTNKSGNLSTSKVF